MIHRYIYNALIAGFDLYKNDPDLIDDLFLDNYELDPAEVSAIKTYFLAHHPSVANGYARQDAQFPLVAIVLSQENETERFLGLDAGQIEDEDDENYTADVESTVWEYVYNLLVYTEHPDVTSYYYELTKSIMLASLEYLNEKGCFEYRVSGTELIPDPRYIPEHLFARQLLFRCQREFQRIDRESKFNKAFRVTGVHIDNLGSSSDAGNIKSLVSIYTAGGDDG